MIMEKMNIEFGGMTRVPDGAMAKDGDMEVLMNVRHEAGELVPMKRPKRAETDENLWGFQIHKNSGCTLAIAEDYIVSIDEMNKILPIKAISYREKTYKDYVEEADMREELLLKEEEFARDFVYRVYSNGVLFLDAMGDMPAFDGATPWEEYNKNIKKIICGPLVASISEDAFKGLVNLELVVYGADYRTLYDSLPEKEGIEEIFFCPPPTVVTSPALGATSNRKRKSYVPEAFYMDFYHLFYDDFGSELNLLPKIETDMPYKAKGIAIMGNIVVVTTETQNLYVIYRNGMFEFLGEIPAFPELTFVLKSHVSQFQTSSKYDLQTFPDTTNSGDGKEDTRNTDNIWWYAKKGFFDSALNQLYEDGDFVDRALFKGALRLFDGSYINLSQTFFVADNEFYTMTTAEGIENKVGPGIDNFKWYVHTQGDQKDNIFNVFVKGFHVEILTDGIPNKWRDIVVAIDVFTTGSIMDWQTVEKFPVANFNDTVEHLGKGVKKGEVWEIKKPELLLKEVNEANVFYKFASYDIDGKNIFKTENTAPSHLAVKDALKDNNNHVLVGDNSFLYNGRLHLYKTKNVLFEGYSDYFAKLTSNGFDERIEDITTEVEIETDRSLEKVVKSIKLLKCYFSNQYLLPPLLTYPDERAKAMTVYFRSFEGVKRKRFNLRRHESLNLAFHLEYVINDGLYYINNFATYDFTEYFRVVDNDKFFNVIKDLFGEVITGDGFSYRIDRYGVNNYVEIQNLTTGEWKKVKYEDAGIELIVKDSSGINRGQVRLSIGIQGDGETNKYLKIKPIAVDDTWEVYDGEVPTKTIVREMKDDVLKVSAVDNPFYFPVTQTYKFDGPIVNMASNTEALSQGQFGQFPLFVFTTEGVWAMQVDTSGKGAYVSQSPFSREVCSGEVLPISGGVVFGTDKGVMAISGGEVVELSQMLDGTSPFMHSYNDGLFRKIYELAGFSMILNPVDIKEYIKGAKLAYNYKNSEIIVSNSDFGFSYVYGLKTQKWSMTDVVFTDTTNSYPELIVYDENIRIEYNNERGVDVPVVLITRPIKFSTLDHKRLRQAALRCVHYSDLYFYVLGSNDGVTFSCITGKETVADERNMRDIITSMSRSRMYKFFSIVVTGRLDADARVSVVQLLVDAGFADNKLR